MYNRNPKMVYRICLIGPPKSGKTTWLQRWIGGTFSLVEETVDMDVRSLSVPTSKGKVRIIVYDVSDRFSYLSCHNVHLCVSFFDASDHKSLYDSMVVRDEFSRRYPLIHILDIGNKSDLGVCIRESSHLCSSKTGEGVKETYSKVVEILVGEDTHLSDPFCPIL